VLVHLTHLIGYDDVACFVVPMDSRSPKRPKVASGKRKGTKGGLHGDEIRIEGENR
jgi:hypothetical protein